MYDSNVLAAQAALFADFEVLFEFAHLAPKFSSSLHNSHIVISLFVSDGCGP
jgi:hypothetical protein